jgi:transposase-like protein
MQIDTTPLPRDDTLPGTLPGFLERFPDDEACAAFLREWKYGTDGFRCPRCGGGSAWFLSSRRLDECKACHKQVSLTAGTIMHRSTKSLRLWFLAMYLFVVSKQGISALNLSRQLGVSYPTAWTWLHKLRRAVSRRPKTLLLGVVEADETWEGGLRKGQPGRPKVSDRSSLVAAAVELREPKGFGRARLASLEDGTIASHGKFLRANVAAGSVLLTDDWRSTRKAAAELGCEHIATNMSKADKEAHEILPGTHRVFSLLHRVLLGTYQGAVSHKHLPSYLSEYEFRFNRRKSRSRSLLFQRLLSAVVNCVPAFYWQIVGRPDAATPLRAAA